jgi:hypothetical protein
MKVIDYVLIVCFVVLIGTCIYLLSSFKEDGIKCVADPFTYAANLFNKSNDATLLCACSSSKGGTFYFGNDIKGLKNIQDSQRITYPSIGNLSYIP